MQIDRFFKDFFYKDLIARTTEIFRNNKLAQYNFSFKQKKDSKQTTNDFLNRYLLLTNITSHDNT